MISSENAIKLIREVEGVKLEAYPDQGNVWTIGYGHTLGVKKGDVIDLEQAVTYLHSDIKEVDDCLGSVIKVPLTQNQYDALTCFIFNIGVPAFKKSTALTLINQNKLSLVPAQFDRWINVKGKPNKGLMNRRAKEKQLFLSQTN